MNWIEIIEICREQIVEATGEKCIDSKLAEHLKISRQALSQIFNKNNNIGCLTKVKIILLYNDDFENLIRKIVDEEDQKGQ